VPNGRTVVIGGLMSDEETELTRKIPLLGDIPAIGALFRRTIKKKEKTELLIFLTPHVVTGAADVEKLTQAERDATELVPGAFVDRDMRKYLPVGETSK